MRGNACGAPSACIVAVGGGVAPLSVCVPLPSAYIVAVVVVERLRLYKQSAKGDAEKFRHRLFLCKKTL